MKKRGPSPDLLPTSLPSPKKTRVRSPSPLSPGTVAAMTIKAMTQEVQKMDEIRNKMMAMPLLTPAKNKMLTDVIAKPRFHGKDTPSLRRLKELYRELQKRVKDFEEALVLSGDESPRFTLTIGPEELHVLDTLYDEKEKDLKMNRLINLYVNLLYEQQFRKPPPLLKLYSFPLPRYLRDPLTTDHVLRNIFTRNSTTYLRDQKVNLPIFFTEDLSDRFTPSRKQALSEFLFNNIENEFPLNKKEEGANPDNLVQSNPQVVFHPWLQKAASSPPLTVSQIPIYFILTSKRLKHAMVSILFENRVFSVGYGYLGSLTKYASKKQEHFLERILHEKHLYERGALYSPDFLLNLFHKKTIAPQQTYYDYKVVDFGLLTKQHMDRMQVFFNKVEQIIFNLGIKSVKGKSVLYKLPTEPTTLEQVVEYSLDGSAILALDQTYSELCFKNKATATMNCAGFINTVFAPSVDCNYFLGVVHPTHCRRTDGRILQNADLEALQTAFIQNDTKKLLELLKS